MIRRMNKKILPGHKIIDNFLPKAELGKLQAILTSQSFDWYYAKHINDNSPKNDLGAYFVHLASMANP